MKSIYEIAELEIVEFEVEDIITTSVVEPDNMADDGANLQDGWGDIN